MSSKDYIGQLFDTTIKNNQEQERQLLSNVYDSEGNIVSRSIVEENNETLDQFTDLISKADQAIVEAVENANNLILAEVQSYKDRIAAGVRTDKSWIASTVGIGTSATITYSLGISTGTIETRYLYGIQWHDYTFERTFPYNQISGIITSGINASQTTVGVSTIQVGFASLGTSNGIWTTGTSVRHYNVVGFTTLNFTGGLTVTGVGSTGGTFTNVTNLTYPDTFLIANNEILGVAGVGGTFVGFGTVGEYRGFDGTAQTTHASGTTFAIAKLAYDVTTLSSPYPEVLPAYEFVKTVDGYVSLIDNSVTDTRRYLEVNLVDIAVGISSGDYVGVGTELFYVTGVTTSSVTNRYKTVGLGTYIQIVQTLPIVVNIGSTQFPSESSSIFAPNLGAPLYETALQRGVSQVTIDAQNAAVASAVAAASTAGSVVNNRGYLVSALNALRTEKLNYSLRKFGYDNLIVTLNEENARVGLAATFLSDPNYSQYMQ